MRLARGLWWGVVRPFLSTDAQPSPVRTAWRGFLRQRARARERATELLPPEERWRPITWRHFRHRVLRHIADRGALSLDELAADPPAVLSLWLNRVELTAVLESARRRQLVEPLAHPRRADGTDAPDEWVLTDAGRRAVRRLGPAIGGSLRTWLTVAGTLVGIFGTSVTLERIGLGPDEALGLAIPLIIALICVGHLRSLLTGAAPARVIGHDWQRWATERPEDHRRAVMFFPLGSLLTSMLVFWTSLVALALLDVLTGVDEISSPLTALVPIALGALAGGRRIFRWIDRWPPSSPVRTVVLEELQQDEDVDHEEDREEDRPAVQVALDERAAAEGAAAATDAERS